MKPISFIRADTCPLCGAERSVEARTNFNHSISLTRYIDSNSTEDLRSRFIYQLRCTRCGHQFFPIWIGNMPYPSVDNDENVFLNNYKQYKTVDP